MWTRFTGLLCLVLGARLTCTQTQGGNLSRRIHRCFQRLVLKLMQLIFALAQVLSKGLDDEDCDMLP